MWEVISRVHWERFALGDEQTAKKNAFLNFMVITTWSEKAPHHVNHRLALPLSSSWSLPSLPLALAWSYRDNDQRSDSREIRSDTNHL